MPNIKIISAKEGTPIQVLTASGQPIPGITAINLGISISGPHARKWQATLQTGADLPPEIIAELTGIKQNQPAPPRIGQAEPALGDIYAGVIRNPKTGAQYRLFMHPQALPKCPWGELGEQIEGADCYWDGLANTRAMCASGKCPEIFAALDALPNAQHYYIPSQAEQALLGANLRDMLAPVWHWTSTQHSPEFACYQYCVDGEQSIDTKDTPLAVRAVRRLPIES